MTVESDPDRAEDRSNPYPGPRPFQRGEKLYGREREITELYLLSAERIVLLHSPSGAGETRWSTQAWSRNSKSSSTCGRPSG